MWRSGTSGPTDKMWPLDLHTVYRQEVSDLWTYSTCVSNTTTVHQARDEIRAPLYFRVLSPPSDHPRSIPTSALKFLLFFYCFRLILIVCMRIVSVVTSAVANKYLIWSDTMWWWMISKPIPTVLYKEGLWAYRLNVKLNDLWTYRYEEELSDILTYRYDVTSGPTDMM